MTAKGFADARLVSPKRWRNTKRECKVANVRHRCFISYHHDDQKEVGNFIDTFDHERKVFIARRLGTGMQHDIIDSDDTDYVLRRIRELYIKDSTVTLVLIGKCTWARRYSGPRK